MKEKAFAMCFVVSLMVSLFLLGSSITGYITGTMYCENGKCHEQCRFDSDCAAGLCCDGGTSGYCIDICENPYVLSPGESAEPFTDSPKSFGTIALLFGIVAAIIALGLIFYMFYPIIE